MDARTALLAAPSTGSALPQLYDYAIGARLERRPMADVYAAAHRYAGTPHLVYVLRPRAMHDAALVHRVGCELDAARWLRHPAVPKLDRQGETPSRRLYVAVERPAGRSLRTVVAEHGAMTAQDLVRLAAPLVEALEDAHALALVHGRLTPDAVIVADDADGRDACRVFLTGLGLGTIAHEGEFAAHERAFISPEQLAGGEPSVRSDVFGLASLLDYALSGRPRGEHGTADDGDAPVVRHGVLADVLRAARSVDVRARHASVKGFWADVLAALVTRASIAEALADDVAMPTLAAPVGPTRRRRAASSRAWWLTVPMAAAFGWPLAGSGARPRTAPVSHAALTGAVPAARLPATNAPTTGVHDVAESKRSAPDAEPVQFAPKAAGRVRAAGAGRRSGTAKPNTTKDGAARTAESRAPRIDVPAVLLIIDGHRAANSRSAVARPDEFGNGVGRIGRAP